MECMNITTNLSYLNRENLDNISISTIISSCNFTLISCTAIIGNFLVLLIIPRLPNKSLHDTSKVFYMALAVADLITGILFIFGPLSIANGGWFPGGSDHVFCQIHGFLGCCMPGISTLCIVLLNIDRYTYIVKPLTYSRIINPKRAIIAILGASSVLIVALFLFVYFSEDSFAIIQYQELFGICLVEFHRPSFLPYTAGLFAVNTWLNAILLTGMYCRLFRISVRHANRIDTHQRAAAHLESGSPSRPRDQIPIKVQSVTQRNLRILRTPLIITGFFFLAYIPYTITSVYSSATGNTIHPALEQITGNLVAMNTAVNIFVYNATRRDFRTALRSLIYRRHCGPANTNVQIIPRS